MKIRLVRAQLFYTDFLTNGQTDGRKDRNDESNSRISQFYESPKICEISGPRGVDNTTLCVLSCDALLLTL
jgi:hypothetical protein